jgi:hypothetical protein
MTTPSFQFLRTNISHPWHLSYPHHHQVLIVCLQNMSAMHISTQNFPNTSYLTPSRGQGVCNGSKTPYGMTYCCQSGPTLISILQPQCIPDTLTPCSALNTWGKACFHPSCLYFCSFCLHTQPQITPSLLSLLPQILHEFHLTKRLFLPTQVKIQSSNIPYLNSFLFSINCIIIYHTI